MDINFLQQYTKTLEEAVRRLIQTEKENDKEGKRRILNYIASLSKNVDIFIKNAQSRDKRKS